MEYAVIIWPAAFDFTEIDAIEAVIKKYGKITYREERAITYKGLRKLMVQLYKKESWAGSFWNNYKNIKYKLNPCYREGKNTYFYVFESISLDVVLQMKDAVRELCKVEKASIHTADTVEETEMVKTLFSELECRGY